MKFWWLDTNSVTYVEIFQFSTHVLLQSLLPPPCFLSWVWIVLLLWLELLTLCTYQKVSMPLMRSWSKPRNDSFLKVLHFPMKRLAIFIAASTAPLAWLYPDEIVCLNSHLFANFFFATYDKNRGKWVYNTIMYKMVQSLTLTFVCWACQFQRNCWDSQLLLAIPFHHMTEDRCTVFFVLVG